MDWQHQAEHLAAGLDVSEEWRPAFAAAPRHVFVPRFFTNHPERGWQAVDHTDDDYLDLVYQDEALITQLDGDPEAWEKTRREGVYFGGHGTSSSSTPGLMAAMLDALDVTPGMSVLEIGTGTGYNAAILCHRLGDNHVRFPPGTGHRGFMPRGRWVDDSSCGFRGVFGIRVSNVDGRGCSSRGRRILLGGRCRGWPRPGSRSRF